MAVAYIPDELMAKVLSACSDKQLFIKEAIEEKLNKMKFKMVVK